MKTGLGALTAWFTLIYVVGGIPSVPTHRIEENPSSLAIRNVSDGIGGMHRTRSNTGQEAYVSVLYAKGECSQQLISDVINKTLWRSILA
jgi:hypothetical protein